jgi:Transposase DDE domain group 1
MSRNRIKECRLDLFADRTSTATMRDNQLRLWFASFAYVLLCALRRIALKHTQFAKANCATIRLKLLKIGALARVSCLKRMWMLKPIFWRNWSGFRSPSRRSSPRTAPEARRTMF